MNPADEIRATARRIRQLPVELQRAELAAGYRAARRLRQAMIDRFTATGIGRAIFRAQAAPNEKAARTRQLRAVFPMPKVEVLGDGRMRISLELRGGIPALVATGGRTKPHRIVAQGARFAAQFGPSARFGGGLSRALAFKVSGDSRFAPAVNHPGAQFKREQFPEAAANDALRTFEDDLAAGYACALARV